MAEHLTGPALDAEICRVVFGLEVETATLAGGQLAYGVRGQHPAWPDHVGAPLPYSADTPQGWGAMRALLLRMQHLGWHARLTTPFEMASFYWCGFTPLGMTGFNGFPDHEAGAETMPLAICRAALKAVAAGGNGPVSSRANERNRDG